MTVSILKSTDDVLIFEFKSDLRTANKLRQTLIGRIPCMAIDRVTFTVNNSVFTNEFLAHRLGLIPMKLRKEKGGNRVTLTVRNETEKIKNVYSSELKGDYEPVYDRILIAKLAPNQEISGEMFLKQGTQHENAKWGTCCVGFEYEQEGTYRFTVTSIGVYTPDELLEMTQSL